MTDYKNEISPEERKRVLLQDEAAALDAKRKSEASTFSHFATSEANADAGRFAAVNKSNVTGSTPFVEYPKLPDSSWTNDPCGVEPPLSFVDEAPIVGEAHEVEASLNANFELERSLRYGAPDPTNSTPAASGTGPSPDATAVEEGPATPVRDQSTRPGSSHASNTVAGPNQSTRRKPK